jgi:phosphatidylglycerophosphatase A
VYILFYFSKSPVWNAFYRWYAFNPVETLQNMKSGFVLFSIFDKAKLTIILKHANIKMNNVEQC